MNTFIHSYNSIDRKKYIFLKNYVNKAKIKAIKKRISADPYMTDLEYLLGAFLEMYEPHLKDVVYKLLHRGYAIEISSGFGSNDSDYQYLDGYFSVNSVTRNKLEKNGVKVREDGGLKSLLFWAEKVDLDYIKEKWLNIIDILPDKGTLAVPSISPQAIEFRRKYVSKNPLLQRQRLFEQLEYRIQITMQDDINRRKISNPNPDSVESRLGLFLEEIEPQVRQAVLEMNNKGYSVDISGFVNDCGDQMIEGDFQLEEQSIKKLKKIDVDVETNPSGYTRLQFSPRKANMREIEEKWKQIASLLPDKKRVADASMTKKAREFRLKY